MVTNCSRRSDWFCLLCSNYVYIKNRIRFNDVIRNRFVKAYTKLPDNLEQSSTPCIVCRTCHNDLQRHLNQNKPLRFIKPAIWNLPSLEDHSDCFMCQFTVHKYNRIAKRLFGYASDTNIIEPIANPVFSDKINNLKNLKKVKMQILNKAKNQDEAVRVVLNDLVYSISEKKPYEFNKEITVKSNNHQLNPIKSNEIVNKCLNQNNKRVHEDDEIEIVKEIKISKLEPNKALTNSVNISKAINNLNGLVNTTAINRPSTFNHSQLKPIKEQSQKDLIMYHDIDIRNGQVRQVTSELTSQEKRLLDLSGGLHQGSYRVANGVELRTYFGKKFKKNRQVQKTSRNEFDDLISMLDISERSAQILETFFERKNYFVWF